MQDDSCARRYARSIVAVLTLLTGAFQAHGADTYGPQASELQIPSLGLGTGNATYSNVVVNIGAIITPPSGTSPNGTKDIYNPSNNQLTVPAVKVGSTNYYNAVVTVANLVSIGSASNVDTFNGTHLTIPFVQVGPTAFYDVGLAVSLANVVAVNGGLPSALWDQFNASTSQLTIPAVQFGSKVYTNVVLNVGLSDVVSTGAPPAGTYTIGGTVSGLASGSQVTLAYNGENALTLTGNGSFTLATSIANAGSYSITVATQPANGQVCSISNGSGTDVTANVTNILVSCAPIAESVFYSFGSNVVNGVLPQGTLIQASDGNFYGMTQYGGDLDALCEFNQCIGAGVVFKITQAGTESVPYAFTSSVFGLSGPSNASLVQASNGNLYGVTPYGGAFGAGTVFEITPADTVSLLHSFDGGLDGASPQGNLLQATDGNLYGVTFGGGAFGAGTVFKITPAGTETALYWFGTTSKDGSSPSGSLIQANDGNFYGVTSSGGANGFGAVIKITPAGAESVLYSFSGTAAGDGASPGGSLIQASDGNFYGLTSGGGVNIGADTVCSGGCGTVFKITPTGSESVLHSFGSLSGDGISPQSSLTQASDGNFYGMTTYGGGASTVCGSGCGVVFKITPTGSESVLHWFGSPGDGLFPTGGLIRARDGNLYGMTSGGGANRGGAVIKITIN